MERTHDTFTDLHLGTPGWLTFSARLLPIGIVGQFLSAGTALFRDTEWWGLHAGLGGALSLPVVALVAAALFVRRLRGFSWWAGLIFLLYLVQVALAAGAAPLALSLHPLNGALLLSASLIFLAKVERRRAQPASKEISP
jgi:hypothetical protein